MKYASVTSCTQNYSQYLIAQLVSMHRHGHTFDVHVLCIDMDEGFLKGLENREWSFNLYLVRDKSDESIDRYAKKARYKFASAVAPNYGALLFLDVDLMFVANVTKFLDLVADTDWILGCNERFKWNMAKYYLWNEAKFEFPHREMMWMICNAPVFVPYSQAKFWQVAWETSYQLRKCSDDKIPSDLFTMNVALWRTGIEDKVIPLPNYAWTGVHNGYLNIYTRAFKKGGVEWRSVNGEPIYMLHGRWDKPNAEKYYLKEQEKRYNELALPDSIKAKHRKLTDKTIQLIKEEYHANSL